MNVKPCDALCSHPGSCFMMSRKQMQAHVFALYIGSCLGRLPEEIISSFVKEHSCLACWIFWRVERRMHTDDNFGS